MHGSASAARRRLAASLEQLRIQAQRELPHELQQPLARADTSASVSDSSPKSVTVSRYGAAALQPGSRHAVAASCDAAAANVGAPWLALRAAVCCLGEGLPSTRCGRREARQRFDVISRALLEDNQPQNACPKLNCKLLLPAPVPAQVPARGDRSCCSLPSPLLSSAPDCPKRHST